MRLPLLILTALLLAAPVTLAQGTNVEVTLQVKKPKPPPDEFKAILSAIEEAYKAPREVDKDVLDELRKQYRNPTPERESKIFKEIRRLYYTTAEQEESIVTELRRAYAQPSVEQEERLFAMIRRNGQLPLGTVPQQAQAELASKLFGKLDRDGDGALNADEMSEGLLAQRAGWDVNRDGVISFAEYTPYYQTNLKVVSAQVAAGEIPVRMPRSEFVPDAIIVDETPRRVDERVERSQPPDLPEWFTQFDTNADGQVALYEWRRMGKSIADFVAMDRNDDGFLEATELALFLSEQALSRSSGSQSR